MNRPEIGAYVATSFIDWTKRVCAVLFCAGCNFRCPWCHNGGLVAGSPAPLDTDGIMRDVEAHAKFLTGIVVSGGEPCMRGGAAGFLADLRERAGLPLKLDTNGSFPDTLEEILASGAVECVALDVKAPLRAGPYSRLCGVRVDVGQIRRSLDIARRFPEYELRTTWVPSLLTEDDMLDIWRDIDEDPNWIVQPFNPAPAMDARLRETPRTSPESIENLRKKIPALRTRG